MTTQHFAVSRRGTIERARRYLSKLPVAVSGQRGHDATFHAAAVLVNGFALEGDAALELLREWNAGCTPPWSERQLLHKLNSAMRAPHRHERGHLLGKTADFRTGLPVLAAPAPAPAKPTFDPANLERIARKLDGADAEWFAARSAKRVDNRTPASFLHELYRDGKNVVVFDVFESQGQAVWTRTPPPFDARALDNFRKGKPHGVWFLANPISGETATNDDGKLSRRSWQIVTAWRYLVLESDTANPEHWLAVLAQMPLPIAAIYTSGGKSIHALVKLDAESREHWNAEADKLKPALITLGADRKAISAVRLTRLPCCERVEKNRMQTLLYLDGNADGTPICERSVR